MMPFWQETGIGPKRSGRVGRSAPQRGVVSGSIAPGDQMAGESDPSHVASPVLTAAPPRCSGFFMRCHRMAGRKKAAIALSWTCLAVGVVELALGVAGDQDLTIPGAIVVGSVLIAIGLSNNSQR